MQLLMSILNEMRNAAQSKNSFVEVHLNGCNLLQYISFWFTRWRGFDAVGWAAGRASGL